MGLYNMMFGQSGNADKLLAILELSREDFYRYRDCYLSEEKEIAVYTRGGGGNREDCISNHESLRDHKLYLRDADDDFDSTYCTFYFRLPENADIDESETEMSREDAWQELFKAMKE